MTRLLLTLVFFPAIVLACSSVPIVKFVLVAIPLYLLWVFVVDAGQLMSGLLRDVHYAERPRFRWIFGAGLALFALWLFLQFTPAGRRMIGVVGPPQIRFHWF